MTAMAIEPERTGARARSDHFYVWMAGACVAVAFLGFAPTYWARMAAGSFKAAPIIHIHGLLFSLWTLFFFSQAWLVARGNVVRHRALGLIGISIATAMCIIGPLAAMRSMAHAAELGAGLMGREFAIVSLSAIVFFAVTIILAIANVHRPEVHKRLMLLGTVSLLQAAAARWFFVLMAPPEARHLSPAETGPAPVAISVPPGLLVDLLLVAAMIYDWRTRGKVHRVYAIGVPALVILQVIRAPLSTTPAWHAVAGWVAGLGG
jgi:hypothetical protein